MRTINIAFDMETRDPDDFFALCFLLSHPEVRLRSVTVMPGSPRQVGLVRHVLDITDSEKIPVGSRMPDHPRECVSGFHFHLLGAIETGKPDGLGHEVLEDTIRQYPDTTVVTGAPLHNLRNLLQQHQDITINRWVAQGGFAGDNVVPVEYRLEKFRGKETCPTFNFNGDVEGAQKMLASEQVLARDLVSKNVTHGLIYDREMHEIVALVKDKTPGLNLIYKGMDLILEHKSEGKKFHDPLASAVAVDRDICEFREVELYREKGEWGALLKNGTSTNISISLNREKFIRTFTRYQ